MKPDMQSGNSLSLSPVPCFFSHLLFFFFICSSLCSLLYSHCLTSPSLMSASTSHLFEVNPSERAETEWSTENKQLRNRLLRRGSWCAQTPHMDGEHIANDKERKGVCVWGGVETLCVSVYLSLCASTYTMSIRILFLLFYFCQQNTGAYQFPFVAIRPPVNHVNNG